MDAIVIVGGCIIIAWILSIPIFGWFDDRRKEKMVTERVVSRYGFVWCPSCEKVEERASDIEPLPHCHSCNQWMEPLLCEATSDCFEEATIQIEKGSYCCREHAA